MSSRIRKNGIQRFVCCPDERRGSLRDDRVAVGAQSSQTGGSAINQRECAGFNWPEPAVPASNPVSISPDAVSRTGSMASARSRMATSPAELPAALRPSRAGERLVGVRHPAGVPVSLPGNPTCAAIASIAAVHRSWGPPRRSTSASAPASERTFLEASEAVGVGHAASIAKSFRFEPCRVAPAARFGCPPPVALLACGLGHDASLAIHARSTWRLRPSGVRPVGDIWPPFGVRPPFGQVGVGQ